MELNDDSDIIYFVDENNLYQLRFSSETDISDDKMFELFTKVDGKISPVGGDL